MKYFALILFLTFNLVFAQQKLNFVQYHFVKSNGYTADQRNDYLFFDDKEKYYLNFKMKKDHSLYQFDDLLKSDFQNVSKDMMLNKKSNSSNYFEYKWHFKLPNSYITSDTLDYKWILEDGNKEILGYNCKKATAQFRGRTWIVWYAPEIASSFGPWKLDGLPGLILEARDENSLLTFVATEIHTNSNYNLPQFVSEFFTLRDKATSYERYITIENNALKETEKEIKASFPIGTQFLDRDLREDLLEKSFEWDVD